VIAIGGLDPSAGAGILADARAIRATGAWAACVCAVLTVQSTRGVRRAVSVEDALVSDQLAVLLEDLEVRALKTGALGSNVGTVAKLAPADVPLIVDPVMSPSRGEGELNADLAQLIERATLLTPNVPEAEKLLGSTISTMKDARSAAASLLELGPSAVLLKGGHLPGERVVDIFATRQAVVTLRRKRLDVDVHGTGCVLASLIAGRLAMHESDLGSVVRWASAKLARWLRASVSVGSGMRVLAAES
ncbi:MAG TPA: hydroxymethylpyrimidine/phosphomethylpyrimidine kinase, partial [Polyangiaceae bacterium]|nr:hydroxymethylpyrimidine/phosphomethylpyrimidine kinase [Polyangiaceae bacterium]